MHKAETKNRAIIACSLAGVLVSTYALYVEMAAEAQPGYKALCDISPQASCTRVLTSIYSKGFGLMPEDSPLVVPNCIYGIIFYCLMILLATYNRMSVVRIQLGLSIASVLSCIYLALLLIFVLKDFCIVCVTMYVVNAVLAALVYNKMKLIVAPDVFHFQAKTSEDQKDEKAKEE